MSAEHNPFEVTFQSEAIAAGDLFLRRMHGVEELSQFRAPVAPPSWTACTHSERDAE